MLLTSAFLVGTGVGGNMPVSGTTLAEFLPASSRGQWMTVLSGFWSLGSFFIAFVGWLVIPPLSCAGNSNATITTASSDCAFDDNYGWRLLVVILAGMNLLSFFCMLRGNKHESPSFLMSRGLVQETNQVLGMIAAENGKAPPSLISTSQQGRPSFNSSSLADDSTDVPSKRKGRVGREADRCRKICVGNRMTLTTVLLCLIWCGSNFGYTSINLFLPTLLKLKTGSGLESTYKNTMIYSAAGLPGSFMGVWAVETRLGRKWTMALSTLGATVAIFFFYTTNTDQDVVLAASCFNCLTQSMFAAIYTYTPEVYRTSTRGTAMGLLTAISKCAGIVAPLLGEWLTGPCEGSVEGDTCDVNGPIVVAGACFAVSVVSMILLPFESKGLSLK
jgi:MFS family permease